MSAPMLIAGLCSLFAVSLLFFGLLVSGQSGFAGGGGGGGGVTKGRAVFKTGNPTLEGGTATLGLEPGKVDIPASIDAARRGVGTSQRQ